MQKKLTAALLACAAVLALCNCIGITADISIRANGSGRIALEYQVSQMLESMGRLDGNERWPAVPAGKADFERSLARIPGLRLVSHKVKDVPNAAGGRDLVTRAVLEFSDSSALLAFLDSSGSRASIAEENGKKKLRLELRNPSAALGNADLKNLLREISAGYGLNISVSVPAGADISIQPAVPSAKTATQKKKVSFSVSMADFLEYSEDVILEVVYE